MKLASSDNVSELPVDSSYSINRFKGDGKRDDDDRSRFTDTQISTQRATDILKYDNLQSPPLEGGGGFDIGGESEDLPDSLPDFLPSEPPTTPKPKKKRNDRSSSPAVVRSKRWKNFSDEALIRVFQNQTSRKTSKQNDSDMRSSSAELARRGIRTD